MSAAGDNATHRSNTVDLVAGQPKDTRHTLAVPDMMCAQEVNFSYWAMTVNVVHQNQVIDKKEAALRGGLKNELQSIETGNKALA